MIANVPGKELSNILKFYERNTDDNLPSIKELII